MLLDTLESEWIDTIFGYPGGSNIPLYTALANSDIRHILARHEQWAAFMAQGYTRSTWKLGVVSATSGPGVANTLTAIADAYRDHIGMLLISGQVARPMIGKNAFQEMDTGAVFTTDTKFFHQVKNVDDIVPITLEAIERAIHGVPWPVHIDIPKDIFLATSSYSWNYESDYRIPELDMRSVHEAKEMLQQAQKPIFLVGHGVKLSDASSELMALLEQLWVPSVETALAKGVVGMDSPQHLGMLGMHGFYEANMAVHNADLIINIWSRFDDRIVWTYDSFWNNAQIIHVDIDPNQHGFVVKPDLPIHADAKDFITALSNQMQWQELDLDNWKEQIQDWKRERPYEILPEVFWGKQVLQKLSDIAKWLDREVIFAPDVGQHQMWASQILEIDDPKNRMFSWGFGTMWFSLPACIGAAIANPDKKVISISWDGWFQMNVQELWVIQQEVLRGNAPDIKIIILDNNYLGMVRQWQDMVPGEQRSDVDITWPDYKLLAQSYGIDVYRFDDLGNMDAQLQWILAEKWPALIWCKVEKEENVFPMVPAGKRLDEMVFE